MSRRIIALVAVALACFACGSDDRPPVAEWRADWAEARARLPSAADIVDGGKDKCDELLGEYRSEFDALTPTPDDSLDTTVTEWANAAESLVFECPHDDAVDLADRFEELDLLTSEVDAGAASLGD